MARKEQNFEVWVGDKKQPVFTVVLEGSLNNSAIVWSLAESPGGVALITKTYPTGVEFSGNEVTVTINPADTADLHPGRYYHQLVITDSQGTVVTAATGQARLRPKIGG